MRSRLITLLVLLLGGLVTVGGTSSLAVAARGPEPLRTVNVSEQGFTKVRLGYASQSTIRHSAQYSVVVRISESAADYLKVERRGPTLSIGLEPGRSYRNVQLLVDIEMPDLEGLDLSGASNCELTGFDLGHGVKFELSGASRLSGQLTAASADFSVSGASSVSLEGESGSMELEGSGASRFDLPDFNAGDLDVNFSGACSGRVLVSRRLKGNLSGGSTLRFGGSPASQDVSASGGSRVIRE